MRVGATIFNQNYNDWDRYEAEELGKPVPKRAVRSDREIFNEEINIARIADETGFDSVWTIEHHFTPYTMVTNPLQYLTYIAGITKRVDLGTMVVVLPWHNPVRVAEDINMLDSFLDGARDVVIASSRTSMIPGACGLQTRSSSPVLSAKGFPRPRNGPALLRIGVKTRN